MARFNLSLNIYSDIFICKDTKFIVVIRWQKGCLELTKDYWCMFQHITQLFIALVNIDSSSHTQTISPHHSVGHFVGDFIH